MKRNSVLSLVGAGLFCVLALVTPFGTTIFHKADAAEEFNDPALPVMRLMEDSVSPSQEVDELDPALSYFFVLGWQLIPRDSDLVYTHTRGGCLMVTAGGRPYLTFPVTIPDGSTIKYVRMWYRDSDVDHYLRVNLNRYEVGQTFYEVTSLESTDADNTAVSAELTEVVDGTSYQYSIDAEWLDPGESLRICGVRVAYYDPFHANFLPSVQRE
jgi:hypothetical protein